MTLRIRLRHWCPRSEANGPGVRAVVWVQGCTLGCVGCFNPETHPRAGGVERPVADVIAWLRTLAEGPSPIAGLSVSGGEPLQQAEATIALCHGAQALGLNVILWTGYAWEEVRRMSFHTRLMRVVDVLIAGRYDQDLHLARGLRGSANKTVHIGAGGRIARSDLGDVPLAEARIAPDGAVMTWTGMHDMGGRR